MSKDKSCGSCGCFEKLDTDGGLCMFYDTRTTTSHSARYCKIFKRLKYTKTDRRISKLTFKKKLKSLED